MSETAQTSWGMEYTIRTCPKRFAREFQAIFPDIDPENALIVPTCQNSVNDLAATGEAVDKEKDELLEKFSEWATAVCASLQKENHWADFIDPCSGLPMIHKNYNCPYGEVEGMSVLLGYETANAAGCKIILHPRWGSKIYPATLFTTGPREALERALSSAN
ncbi:hypothetical protein BSKO_07309 [Bryopsis sp. KO-2023]|nr:hypothetical protein BSKO_07309 [Bryopsis sp. KO-2023]